MAVQCLKCVFDPLSAFDGLYIDSGKENKQIHSTVLKAVFKKMGTKFEADYDPMEPPHVKRDRTHFSQNFILGLN